MSGTTPVSTTFGPFPWSGRTLPDLWAEAVLRSPDRNALECDGSSMSMAEIDRCSGRVAAGLAAAGIGRGDVVAVVVGRSVFLPAALLGVLRCGAAFVPVDPAYPDERRTYMLRDSRARAMVTLSHLAQSMEETQPTVLLDAPGTSHVDGVQWTAAPGDLAYVMYTSGSTGRPKGVEISHQALSKGVLAMSSVVRPFPGDTWLSVTSPSFDPSLVDLFLPLLTGGRLVIATDDQVVAGDALHALLMSSAATVLQATPLTWRMLLADGWRGRLRTALCGGEAMHVDLAAALGERCEEVWNIYGPTETTIWSTAHRVTSADTATVPVGRPLPDTEVLVLDENLARAQPGAVGEIWIGGTGVGLGYRGQDELTADRFPPHPLGPPGERIYRTGDLGRRRADGTLELLGRADSQVKIRGHRVEPGEVEHRLLEHGDVESAAVIAHSPPDQTDARLVAYVRLVAPGTVTPAQLLDFLRARLPGHLVPSSVTEVEQWPRTPSGKIDRNALPRPDAATASADAGCTPSSGAPPRTATERALARIWEEILGHGPVARTDDFFALGGHSLLSMRLIARIREELGAQIAVRDLIATPILSGLADRVAQAPSTASPRVPAGPPGPAGLLPVSPEQAFRLARERWRAQQNLGPGTHNVSAACRVDGRLWLDALEQALTDVVTRHEALRTRFLVDNRGTERQEITPVRPVRLLHRTVSGDEGLPTTAVAELANAPFDLTSGMLFRAAFWDCGDDTGVLLITCDHVVSDQVSMAVLLGDLQRAYAARRTGTPVVWDGPEPNYRAYLRDEAAWLASPEADAVIEEWRKELDGTPPYWPMTDLIRPAPPVERRFLAGEEPVAHLSRETTDALTSMAKECRASLFHCLLALVAVALSDITGQERTGVLTPMANREAAGSGGLVAYTANSLPVILETVSCTSFADQIEQARDRAVSVLARQRLPLAEVVRRLDPEAFGRPSPAPYILVNYIETNLQHRSTTLVLKGTTTTPLALSTALAPAPVILAFLQSPQQLTVHLSYDRDLITAATARRLLDTVISLARQAADTPGAQVADLLASTGRIR
ncbi:amino acid adenylation domain-containing protein [Streptomyces sp. NPDC018019]|uniref:amino acid adenylation domain-containing protein n=1 Tax=Streptomyces sp. NPDC018019 TaxID=3365030 RepID=UPI00379CC6A8